VLERIVGEETVIKKLLVYRPETVLFDLMMQPPTMGMSEFDVGKLGETVASFVGEG